MNLGFLFYFVLGLIWLFNSVAIFFGYQPDKFSIFVAFIYTAGVMFKWAYDEWNKR